MEFDVPPTSDSGRGLIASAPRVVLVSVLAIATIAAWPALTGSWVYDDLRMLENPYYEDWNDVRASLLRTSNDYLTDLSSTSRGQYTYRPITMFTLVLTHVASRSRPWAHHLVSLAAHIAVVLLFIVVARGLRGRVDVVTLSIAAVLACHPALGEAWLWINGRSDPMAGLAVVLAALVLFKDDDKRALPGWKTWISVGVFTLLGLGGKEIAFFAIVALVVARVLPRSVDGLTATLRQRLVSLTAGTAACTAGLVVWMAMRWWAGGAMAGSPSVDVGRVLARVPALLSLAVETFIVPIPRPMRALAWELHAGWPSVAVLAVVLGALVLLLARRRWRELALLVGAMLTLAPAAFVADENWLGFDRYLYVPAVLLGVTFVMSWPIRPDVSTRSWRIILPLATAAILAVPLRAQARIYHSHRSWIEAMTTFQPESPITRLHAAHLALANGDRNTAVALADVLASESLPPALRHAAADLEIRLGRWERAGVHIEAASDAAPHMPRVCFDLLVWRGVEGRWDEALELAEGLVETASMCPAVQRLARSWIEQRQLPQRYLDRVRGRVLSVQCEQ
jgi:hypothetical protein